MRQYFQGTLDFACGLYAVVNALSCLGAADLRSSRSVLREFLMHGPADPPLWHSFLSNETDHYWLVRRTLEYCCGPGQGFVLSQPFDHTLLPGKSPAVWKPYLPEKEAPGGPACPSAAAQEAGEIWSALETRLACAQVRPKKVRTAAVLRFHRFLPGLTQPVVSHWTTAYALKDQQLFLNDASAEKEAITRITLQDCLASGEKEFRRIRIVPESMIFIQRRGS